jgi:cytochrome c-type biogenesis protein
MLVALGLALWLGILTSISPCPLAANIAAISYISRRTERKGLVLASGIFYTIGRSLTYTVLGVLVAGALLNIPDISRFLQDFFNELLGPLLILTGMFLLGMLRSTTTAPKPSDAVSRRLIDSGVWGSLVLGMLFALAFCPVSAALFFGSLIPIAVEQQSTVLLPLIYGLGTGLPVLVFALVIAFAVSMLGRLLKAVNVIEAWFRRITGVVFIGVGIYYSLKYIFEVI